MIVFGRTDQRRDPGALWQHTEGGYLSSWVGHMFGNYEWDIARALRQQSNKKWEKKRRAYRLAPPVVALDLIGWSKPGKNSEFF